MIDKVIDTIKRNDLIKNGESIVVGVSGGPDSVCLLHILHSLAPELNIKIFAVHINHMLRGEEGDCDEKYVHSLCKKLGIPMHAQAFNIKEISKQKGMSLEEAGREVRYLEFERVAQGVGAEKIAVAHNRNDRVETVLMHIIRGTGLDGLKGINYKRSNIIRPLLDIGRKDIENYCERYTLNPRIDRSNLESIYTRNRIRLDLIPYISKTFDTDITESIYKMSLLLSEDQDFIDGFVMDTYEQCIFKREKDGVCLRIKEMQGVHAAVRKRLIRSAIKEIKGDLKGIENIHIEDIVNLAQNGRTGAEIHLPCSIHAEKSYDVLKIYIYHKLEKNIVFDEALSIPGATLVEGSGFFIEALIEKNVESIAQFQNISYDFLVQYFDYEKLRTGINIRSRKDGDIFKPFKSNGTKKLKEYFIDNKVPRAIRDEIPLIAKDNEIVWIIGYKISDKFKVTENTKSVLKLKYIKR